MLLNRKTQRGSRRRAEKKKSRTTDGAEDIDYEIAARVVDDVRRGTTAAGTGWLLTITFQAESLLELQRATRAIQSAATRSRVRNLRFLTGRHDLGLAVSLPLARGLRKVRRFGL